MDRITTRANHSELLMHSVPRSDKIHSITQLLSVVGKERFLTCIHNIQQELGGIQTALTEDGFAHASDHMGAPQVAVKMAKTLMMHNAVQNLPTDDDGRIEATSAWEEISKIDAGNTQKQVVSMAKEGFVITKMAISTDDNIRVQVSDVITEQKMVFTCPPQDIPKKVLSYSLDRRRAHDMKKEPSAISHYTIPVGLVLDQMEPCEYDFGPALERLKVSREYRRVGGKTSRNKSMVTPDGMSFGTNNKFRLVLEPLKQIVHTAKTVLCIGTGKTMFTGMIEAIRWLWPGCRIVGYDPALKVHGTYGTHYAVNRAFDEDWLDHYPSDFPLPDVIISDAALGEKESFCSELSYEIAMYVRNLGIPSTCKIALKDINRTSGVDSRCYRGHNHEIFVTHHPGMPNYYPSYNNLDKLVKEKAECDYARNYAIYSRVILPCLAGEMPYMPTAGYSVNSKHKRHSRKLKVHSNCKTIGELADRISAFDNETLTPRKKVIIEMTQALAMQDGSIPLGRGIPTLNLITSYIALSEGMAHINYGNIRKRQLYGNAGKKQRRQHKEARADIQPPPAPNAMGGHGLPACLSHDEEIELEFPTVTTDDEEELVFTESEEDSDSTL